MLADDDQTASDHLPVIMYFNNPFSQPFRLLAIGLTNQDVTLTWESASGRLYWCGSVLQPDRLGDPGEQPARDGTNCTFTTNTTEALRFFRVYRVP